MEILSRFILLLFYSSLLLSNGVYISARVYNIVPTEQTSSYKCQVNSCLTLSQFAQKSNIALNTILIISGGNHNLDVGFSVSNVTKFVMLSTNNTNLTSSSVNITCARQAKLKFTNISSVYLSRLNFKRCNDGRFEFIHELTIENSIFTNSKSPITLADSRANMTRTNFYFNSESYTSNTERLSQVPVASLGGTLLVTRSTLAIESCHFVGNTANSGGAIHSKVNSSVTIIDSHFMNNQANGYISGHCSGGAILIEDRVTMIVINTKFFNNTSSKDGGVATIINANLLFSNCIVHMNTANRYGGAVAAFSKSNLTLINSTELFNNSAVEKGGAMYLEESNTTINDCEISCNNARGDGGAVYEAHTSAIQLNNSMLKKNQAQGNGGVLYGQNNSYVAISNCSFFNNTSSKDGGVATIINASLLFLNCIVHMNSANRYGGAVAAFSKSNLTLINSTELFNNSAVKNGGAMYLEESNATISDCEISCNNARGDGGAVYEAHTSAIQLNNSMLKKNQAQGNGGVLYGQNNSYVAISNCSFFNNTAENGGVARITIDSDLYLSVSNFSGNNANVDGGVAFIYDKSTVSVKNCYFVDNLAGDYGGALRIERSSRVAVSDSNFVDNRADYGGALEVNNQSNASIASSNFIKNSVKNKGAAIQLYVNCIAAISGSTFNWNEAGDLGGVYGRRNCNISIRDSIFYNNTAEYSGAGVYIGHDSIIHIDNCTFLNSTADFGAAIVAYVRSAVTVTNSGFTQNRAAIEGGAIHAYKSCSITVQNSSFILNLARSGGACLALLDCKLTFQDDVFFNNSADFGGVIGLLLSNNISVTGSIFVNNTAAQSGGVLYVQDSKVVIDMSSRFKLNSGNLFGGVIHATDNCIIIINTATFSNNTADDGGVLSLLDNSLGIIEHSNFISNQANESGGVVYLNEARIGIFNSRFNLSSAYRRGGVISASAMSEVYVTRSNFSHNTAKVGAALAIEEKSSLSFAFYQDFYKLEYEIPTSTHPNGDSEILIYNNTAFRSGGGIYLNDSSFSIGTETKLNVSFNKARLFGGGILAIHSSIIVKNTVHFISNEATSGGALSLRYSKIFDITDEGNMVTYMNFVSNKADKGGALHIRFNNDNENIADVCSGENPFISGCFFQSVSDNFMIYFDKNFAEYEGHDLFGGLLDRCTVTNSTSQSLLEANGIARFKSISNITNLNTISSKPVRVCLCINSMPICIIRVHTVQVKQRGSMLLSLAAVDQVEHEVTATIHSCVEHFNLSKNQATQTIDAACSSLEYYIAASPRPVPYQATIYADGPCGDKGISKLTVNITVVPCTCALGLVVDDSKKECKCKCDEQLIDYIKECDPEMDSVKRKGVFWISTTDKNDGNFSYIIFPYCPVGYCQSPNETILVNLSHQNGTDAQCANNHGGLLCGKCQPGYSLSLSGSKCIQCHRKWYKQLIGIIIASLFAGILLVAIILVLNLTVAVGTLNSIIFYANIVYSNRILRQSQLISVFISWLNLDIGFDVCLYEGMDAYTKTWFELAFPAYIIFLVIVIIWISSHSSAFSNLIGKRNPVATLATLILISYAKCLQTIIITFSFVKSDGGITPVTRWLYDASIAYFGWKHALLFCMAVLILILGLFYTILLFSWQWLLHCPRSKVFNWTRNQKLHSFIDTYHTPHMAKHRYWSGLLLLARVILYLIAAFSASVYTDPHIPVLATIVVICCLLLFKTVMMIKVYRNWLLNAMDTFMYFNIVIPAIFAVHTFTDQSLQSKVINVSVGITIVLLCFIIAFHVYRYGSVKLYTYCQNTKLCDYMTRWLSFIHSPENILCSPSDGRLLDVLDSLRQDESEEIYDQHDKPTSSVVSLVHSDESPSSDYYLKLNEGENQSDYQPHIDEGNIILRQERVKSASTQQGSNNTKKIELSSYFPQDENIGKPLLDETL